MPRNYYNENDPFAARWLRNLIAAGEIPGGDVDDRSIRDVSAGDVAGYSQCHFFAGIGGWSLALRIAGWPIGRNIWTGSCPCQPFSVAGKRLGTEDDRHLWPEFFRLIRARRPAVVMGEQVARADGRVWFAAVRDDLETIAYAARAVIIPACAVEAPHERERLWFVAHANSVESQRNRRPHEPASKTSGIEGQGDQRQRGRGASWNRRERDGALDDPDRQRFTLEGLHLRPGRQDEETSSFEGPSESSALGNASMSGLEPPRDGAVSRGENYRAAVERTGFWSGAEWLDCADGKRRRLKPGTALLVNGLPSEVAGAISGFGNAIVPQVAAEIIGAYLDAYP